MVPNVVSLFYIFLCKQMPTSSLGTKCNSLVKYQIKSTEKNKIVYKSIKKLLFGMLK